MHTESFVITSKEFEDTCTKVGNQNPYIKEGQITQWQRKKYKETNNDRQDIHIQSKIELQEPH